MENEQNNLASYPLSQSSRTGLNISPNATGRLEIEVGSELCCAMQRCMTLHMLISMSSAYSARERHFLGPESDTGW